MKQIDIGTCIPGPKALEWIPGMDKLGFACYALNFHMSLEGVKLEELAPRVRETLAGSYVASVGYYCNPLQHEDHQKTLEYVIDNAHLFGTNMVSTFGGAIEGKSVEESMPAFKKVFTELTRRAEDKGVKLVLENCPMGGTWNNLTCNLAFNPKAWEMMFNEVPSDALGLEWEPGHQMIQLIDPIAQLRQWVKKIYHLHGKDASIDMDAVRRLGVMGAHDFAPQRTPGYGDTDWRQVFSILYANGYEGNICIEGYHDPVYNDDWETTAQKHALSYLTWCRGGNFTPNVWND